MSRITLPPGSKNGLEIITKLLESHLTDLSVKLLNSLPIIKISELFSDSDCQRISSESRITKAELTLAIKILTALWKQASFNAIKVETFKTELCQLSIPENTIEYLTKIWENNNEKTLNRLRDLSHSGIPELQDINWSILLERASSYQPKKRELRALLQLETDQGKMCTKMTYEELQNLHYTLQSVQKKMDSITKS